MPRQRSALPARRQVIARRRELGWVLAGSTWDERGRNERRTASMTDSSSSQSLVLAAGGATANGCAPIDEQVVLRSAQQCKGLAKSPSESSKALSP